jgi:hypothetical protein
MRKRDKKIGIQLNNATLLHGSLGKKLSKLLWLYTDKASKVISIKED